MNDDKAICPYCGAHLVHMVRKKTDWWGCPDCCEIFFKDADGVLV